MATFFPAGGGTYTLNASIGSTDTTFTLSSFTEPVSGVPYTMALLNTSIAYGTFGPRTTNSEFISFTGITQNADGTATITGVTRGLAKKYPFTGSATFRLPHAGQTVFILSDAPQVFNKYAALVNDNTLSGDNTFSVHSPTIPTEISSEVNRAASIGYANALAIAGAPDASTTVKGIVELATAAETAAGTATGGTGATLVPQNATFNATSSAAVLVPVTNSSGKISSGFGGAASSLATLDGSSLVVQNPANATATPTSSKIPISSGSTVLDVGWIDTGTSANKIVKLNGSAQLPAVDGSLLTNVNVSTNGVTTRAGDAASGAQNIAHGLGRNPKTVYVSAATASAGTSHASSNGTYNGTTTACLYQFNNAGTMSSNTDTTNGVHIAMYDNSTKIQVAVITKDSTNITLTWTRTGSTPADTIYIQWVAIG